MRGLWHKFKTKGFALKKPQHRWEATEGNNRPELKRALGPFDLLLFGIGSIIGSGVFVLTGQVARETAGPSVIVSYAIASLAAMLCGLCYVEFAADIPESGTAFVYLFEVYGEFISWISAFNLLIEYSLCSSSVSKGFTSYFATLLGLEPDILLFKFDSVPFINIDLAAFLLIMGLCILLCVGVKDSSIFNIVITSINIATIVFTICYGFRFFDADNLKPFMPFKIQGVFHATSIVFFSYLGFDGVAAVVEETLDPKKSLPIGIIGSIGACAVLYMLMSLALVGMVRYTNIDPSAAFSVIFTEKGQPLLSSFVSFGALTGIVTSALTALLSQSRIFMSLGRHRFLPSSLADIHPKTHTPVKATILTCALAAVPALLFDLEILSELVSIGSLFVLSLVCSGIIWRAHCIPGNTGSRPTVGVLMTIVFLGCLGEGLVSCYAGPLWLHILFLGIWLAGTIGFKFVPTVYKSTKFSVPLNPFIPSLGVLCTIHLILSLGWLAHIRFLIAQILGIAFYFVYTLHKSPDYSLEQHLVFEEASLLPSDHKTDDDKSVDDEKKLY